jgi:hypothetical protein
MARKPAKAKTLFVEDNYKNYLELCASSGLPYRIIESNYTLSIESDFCNVTFMQNVMNKKAFIAGAKIKRDIKNTGLEPPEFDEGEMTYFNFAPIPELINCPKTIYNIDIKSAYANVLNNHSLILPETFNYMKTLIKKDRLACVGMLASSKDIYECLGNEELEYHNEIKDTKNWFYFCVNIINKIMEKIKKAIKSFLFYWVDGLFFHDKKEADLIMNILDELGYNYSFEVCTEFVYSDEGKQQKLKYYKSDGTLKVLTLPKKNNDVDKFLLDFLGI